MYFSLVPNIEYDEKPISYPFSESDYVVAKNFFRRYRISEDIFQYAVLFNKYTIVDGDRPDTLANRAYGNPFYDWVILMTNNMVNAQYDWPLTNRQLSKTLEKEFDDPYGTIHHYETYKIGPYSEGLHVDETFYNKVHKLNIDGRYELKNGNEICRPVTVAEYYDSENEKKRSIYLLKPRYFRQFVDDFRKNNLYKEDANFISQRLKKTG
jgi:hypothetical protein